MAPKSKAANATDGGALLAESARVQLLAECNRVRALLVERDETLQTLLAQSEEARERFAQQIALKEAAMEQLSLEARASVCRLEEVARSLAEKENQLERITNSLAGRLLGRYGRIKYSVLLPAYKSIGRLLKSDTAHQDR